MSISRHDYAEYHESAEYLRASEAGYYDNPPMGVCDNAACQCVVPKDELDEDGLCRECAEAFKKGILQ